MKSWQSAHTLKLIVISSASSRPCCSSCASASFSGWSRSAAFCCSIDSSRERSNGTASSRGLYAVVAVNAAQSSPTASESAGSERPVTCLCLTPWM
eukprot:2769606-Prymnesium_polylepis.1